MSIRALENLTQLQCCFFNNIEVVLSCTWIFKIKIQKISEAAKKSKKYLRQPNSKRRCKQNSNPSHTHLAKQKKKSGKETSPHKKVKTKSGKNTSPNNVETRIDDVVAILSDCCCGSCYFRFYVCRICLNIDLVVFSFCSNSQNDFLQHFRLKRVDFRLWNWIETVETRFAYRRDIKIQIG